MQSLFASNGDLIRALTQGYLLGSRTIITATGASTYTTPTNCRLLVVDCIGGGGGGEAVANSGAGQIRVGCGGTNGAITSHTFATVSGRTFSAVVSAGGASGSTGTITSFTDNIGLNSVAAAGGGAGATFGGVTSGSTEIFGNNNPSSSGTSVGDYISTGFYMGNTHRVSGTVALAGQGSAGIRGGSPLPQISQGNGSAGGNYGAGGSGAWSANAGGAQTGGHGGQGVIIVWEFY